MSRELLPGSTVTAEQVELARALVGMPWWRGWREWPEGMAAIELRSGRWVDCPAGWPGAIPDLSSAATGGVLLGMLLERVPGIRVEVCNGPWANTRQVETRVRIADSMDETPGEWLTIPLAEAVARTLVAL